MHLFKTIIQQNILFSETLTIQGKFMIDFRQEISFVWNMAEKVYVLSFTYAKLRWDSYSIAAIYYRSTDIN